MKVYVLLIMLLLLGMFFNFQYMFYSILCYLILVFSGLGLTLSISPHKIKKYAIFISPIIGFSYLVTLGWYLFFLDFKGTDQYGIWLLIPPALLLVPHFYNIKKIFNHELLFPISIALVCFIIISIPMLSHDYLTSLVIGNNDIASYSFLARELKEFSKDGLTGFAKNRDNGQITNTVFGSYWSIAFFGSILGLETYQVDNIINNVFFIVIVLLVYIISLKIFKYNGLGASALALLFGLNSIMFYTLYHFFYSQIIASAISLVILLINWHILEQKKLFDAIRYTPMLGLLNIGLSLTYPHMLPIVYVPIGFYVFLKNVVDKHIWSSIYWFISIFVAFMLMAFASPYRLEILFNYFFLMKKVVPGWVIPLITPEQMFGLTVFDHMPGFANITRASFFIVLIIFYGLNSLYHRNKRIFLFSISIFVFIVLGYVLMLFINYEEQDVFQLKGLGGYKHYKFLSFFLPQLYIVSLVFFRDLKLKSFPMLLFIAILILTLSTIIYNVEAAWTNHLWVSQEMAQLKDIESFENVSSINLLNHQKDLWWDNLWEHNFLLKKNIYNEIPTYYPKSILKGEWFLINNMSENVSFYHIFNNSLVFDGILKYELPLNNSCFINSEYTMVKPSYSFSVSLGDGWHAQEPTHCWTSSKNSTVLIFSSEDKQVNMSVQVIPFDNDNMLSVYVNDKLVQNFTDNMNFSLSLSLKSGENTIFFKSFLPPQQPGINDKRYIGYAFRQIKLLARL